MPMQMGFLGNITAVGNPYITVQLDKKSLEDESDTDKEHALWILCE